jgi:hypothetical protein
MYMIPTAAEKYQQYDQPHNTFVFISLSGH